MFAACETLIGNKWFPRMYKLSSYHRKCIDTEMKVCKQGWGARISLPEVKCRLKDSTSCL